MLNYFVLSYFWLCENIVGYFWLLKVSSTYVIIGYFKLYYHRLFMAIMLVILLVILLMTIGAYSIIAYIFH